MPEAIADVLKSKAVVWIAPAGEARPDETSVAAGAAWGGNWVKVGWTKEPLTMLYEYETHQFHVEQILAAIDEQKTSESLALETVLSEATALNLDYLSGGDGTNVTTTAAGASQVGYEELDIGDNPVLEKWAVGFEGINYDETDGALPVRIFIDRATVKINGELEFSQKNDDYTGIPLQVFGLANTASSNRLFTWQRVTAAATS